MARPGAGTGDAAGVPFRVTGPGLEGVAKWLTSQFSFYILIIVKT